MVDIVSKGGNYLLNIGPDAEGAIPPASIERLQAMGAWLDVNGAAIYSAQPGPVQGLDWCRTTQKGDSIYLHIFEWRANGRFVLPKLEVQAAEWLDGSIEAPLSLAQEGDRTVLLGPAVMPKDCVTVICLRE